MRNSDAQDNTVKSSKKKRNKRKIDITDRSGIEKSIENHSLTKLNSSNSEPLEENSDAVDNDREEISLRFRNSLVKLAFIIVVGIFLVVILLMGYSYYRETIFLRDLSNVDRDNFIFYYPKAFVQNQNSDVELDYKSPYTNQRGFSSTIRFFNVESLNKASKIKDKETCKLFVEGKIDNASNENMETDNQGYTIEKLEFDNFFGKKTCYFVIKYDMAKLFDNEMLTGQYIIAEAKVIVMAEKAIGVYANYDDITLAEERDALSRSIIFFDSR